MYDIDQAYSIVNEVRLATCLAFDEIILRIINFDEKS